MYEYMIRIKTAFMEKESHYSHHVQTTRISADFLVPILNPRKQTIN